MDGIYNDLQGFMLTNVKTRKLLYVVFFFFLLEIIFTKSDIDIIPRNPGASFGPGFTAAS